MSHSSHGETQLVFKGASRCKISSKQRDSENPSQAVFEEGEKSHISDSLCEGSLSVCGAQRIGGGGLIYVSRHVHAAAAASISELGFKGMFWQQLSYRYTLAHCCSPERKHRQGTGGIERWAVTPHLHTSLKVPAYWS